MKRWPVPPIPGWAWPIAIVAASLELTALRVASSPALRVYFEAVIFGAVALALWLMPSLRRVRAARRRLEVERAAQLERQARTLAHIAQLGRNVA